MSKNNAPSVYAEISRIYHDPAAQLPRTAARED